MTWMEPVDAAQGGRVVAPPPVLACPQVVARPRLGLSWILRGSFERLLDGLLDKGWVFLDLDRYEAAAEGLRSEERGVLLSFDRANPEFLEEVEPILLAREIPCVLFVPTAEVGRMSVKGLGPMRARQRQLGWQQLRELGHRGARTQVLGHHLLDLRTVTPEVAFGELIRARREIERRLQQEARALVYPYGSVDPELARLAASAGFRIGFGNGKKPEETGLMNLSRIRLKATDRPGPLAKKLERLRLRRAEGLA